MENAQHYLSRRSVLAGAGAATVAITQAPNLAHGKTTSRAKLFMTEVGAGKNVIFLHGWTCDSHDWSWQLPLFENKYRVVAVDLRGHGRSEVMPSGGYMPADYVADIEALISTRYPGQKFIIVGHSMGGQIAARLAAKAAGPGQCRRVRRRLAWFFQQCGQTLQEDSL